MSFSSGSSSPKSGFQESSVSSITNPYMRSALFWEFTYWEYYSKKNSSWNFWPLKFGPIAWPETSVQIYHSTLRKIPKRTDHLYIAVKAWNHESIYFSLSLYEIENRSFTLTDEHRLQTVELRVHKRICGGNWDNMIMKLHDRELHYF